MDSALLTVIIAFAVMLAYVNGFHDASNAVSTTITTRALRESTALASAALLNLLGALLGGFLVVMTAPWAADLLGLSSLVEAMAHSPQRQGQALLGIVMSAIVWLLATWWIGMPASTWSTVLGAAVGASLSLGAPVAWGQAALTLLLPVLIGPVVAAAVSYLAMDGLLRLGRSERLSVQHLRFLQTVSAGLVAAAHGLHDVRIPLAVIAVAFAAFGVDAGDAASAVFPVALALGAGTLMGGHRIIRTLGRRISDLSTAQGLAAETAAAAVVAVGMLGFKIPVSTSHSLASGVVGAGLAMGPRHVRWPVVGRMLGIWFLSPLISGLLAGVITLLQVRLSS